MSDNKKYYYLKLKDNFFDQDHIKYIESMTHGYIYSNILMKLYLRSLKYDGCLKITENIPYDPGNIEPLAKVIGHDPSHVGEALNLAASLDIVKIIDMREMWFTDIQNYIGESSTEGDRKRVYRAKLKEIEERKPKEPEIIISGHLSDDRPPELEIELEKERDIIHHFISEWKNNNLPMNETNFMNYVCQSEYITCFDGLTADEVSQAVKNYKYCVDRPDDYAPYTKKEPPHKFLKKMIDFTDTYEPIINKKVTKKQVTDGVDTTPKFTFEVNEH